MRSLGTPPARIRSRGGRWPGWLAIGPAVLGLAACTALRVNRAESPRVFDLATVPPKTVMAGCPVIVTFQTASRTDLVHAKVVWRLTRVTARRVVVDHWYAILPISGGAQHSRSHGLVALQLTPRDEGTYDYAVEVKDTEGLTSNVLKTTVVVGPRVRDLPCPPADPVLRPPSTLRLP
jgi:hypothetical protein